MLTNSLYELHGYYVSAFTFLLDQEGPKNGTQMEIIQLIYSDLGPEFSTPRVGVQKGSLLSGELLDLNIVLSCVFTHSFWG